MPPRITRTGHKKSRHGCLRCKLRHVKCDEQQPCQNCRRHKVECSLVVQNTQTKFPPPATISAGSLPGAGAGAGCIKSSDISAHPPTVNQYQEEVPSSWLAKASKIKNMALELENEIKRSQTHEQADNAHLVAWHSKPASSPDWMKSLRLLNHYYTSTCLTLNHDDATLHLWRTVVPELAVSHELLMHGLLAISALHYAHVHPDERKSYIMVSNYHQGRALDFFSTMLTDINDHNCEAFFILAIFIFLLAAWSVANPQDQVDPLGLGAVTQSFALIQGIKDIIEYPTGKRWSEGPLSPLFEQWETPPIDPSLPFAKRLDKLSTLVQSIGGDDDEGHDLCRAGLESLRKAYALHLSAHSGRHRMWMWPVELGKQRFNFTRCRHPIALVILAHCAALVNCSEGPSWLWHGWGESVLHIAEQELLQVSQEWQEWLRWPLRCIHDNLDVDNVSLLEITP